MLSGQGAATLAGGHLSTQWPHGDKKDGQRLGSHSRGCHCVGLDKAPYLVPPLNQSWDWDNSEHPHCPVPYLKKIGEGRV